MEKWEKNANKTKNTNETQMNTSKDPQEKSRECANNRANNQIGKHKME